MTESLLTNGEAESAVLGALLFDNTNWDRVADLLVSDDFTSKDNQEVFNVIGGLVNSCRAADSVTVSSKLSPAIKNYLTLIESMGAQHGEHARQYALIVREYSIRRKAEASAAALMTKTRDTKGTPVADIVEFMDGQAGLMSMEAGSSRFQTTDITPGLTRLLDRLSDLGSSEERPDGAVLTGFADIDRITGGFAPGDLIVLAARTSMGKTSMATNIASHIAIKQNLPVHVFSLEANERQFTERLFCSVAGVDNQKLVTGLLTEAEWAATTDAIETLRLATILTSYQDNTTLAALAGAVRKSVRQNGKLGLIVIDYLQLMEGEGETRALALSAISRGLKLLAREVNAPILLLSQLDPLLERRLDRRPVLSDLWQSGSLEADADLVMFIHQNEFYECAAGAQADSTMAEVILAKSRGGPKGSVKMPFEGQYFRFRSAAGL